MDQRERNVKLRELGLGVRAASLPLNACRKPKRVAWLGCLPGPGMAQIRRCLAGELCSRHVVLWSLADPRSYEEILQRNLVRDRDFRVAFGDANIEKCLLIAPHGGGIEPGTSEIMRAVAGLGGWAWYEFAGYLRRGNKEALHIPSTEFNEPTLLALLPQTEVVAAFHGSDESGMAAVHVGGKWKLGRQATIEAINESFHAHGIRAIDATENKDTEHISGLHGSNITNRGRRSEGIQMEFSREARNLLFPPDAAREARGRRSTRLLPLARSLDLVLKRLTGKNWTSASSGRD